MSRNRHALLWDNIFIIDVWFFLYVDFLLISANLRLLLDLLSIIFSSKTFLLFLFSLPTHDFHLLLSSQATLLLNYQLLTFALLFLLLFLLTFLFRQLKGHSILLLLLLHLLLDQVILGLALLERALLELSKLALLAGDCRDGSTCSDNVTAFWTQGARDY